MQLHCCICGEAYLFVKQANVTLPKYVLSLLHCANHSGLLSVHFHGILDNEKAETTCGHDL